MNKIKFLLYLSWMIFGACEQVPSPVGALQGIPEDPAWKFEYRFSKPGSPRIAVVSHYTTEKENKPFIELATQNHIDYAKKHNYDYYFRNGTLRGTEKFRLPNAEKRTFQLGLYWQKIQAIWDLLKLEKDGKYVYDYVFWIDTDAVFTNMDQLLEQFIEDADKNNFLFIAEDVLSHSSVTHTCINSGVFMIKNSPEGREFIQNVMRAFKIYGEVWVPEQAAIQDLAFGFLDPADIDKVANNETLLNKLRSETGKRICNVAPKKGVKIYRMRDFNAGYPWDFEEIAWGANSFTAHFFTLNGIMTKKYMEPLLDCLSKNNYTNREKCTPKNLNIALNEFELKY